MEDNQSQDNLEGAHGNTDSEINTVSGEPSIVETAKSETATTAMYTTQPTNAYAPTKSKWDVILETLRNPEKRKKVLIVVGIVLILLVIWATSPSSSYSKGLTAMKDKQWDNAIAAFSQVKESDKNYENAKNQIEEAQRTKQEEILAAQKKKQEEEALKTSAEKYTLGLAAMTNKDWNKAINSFESVISKDPNYQDALSKIKEANNILANDSLTSGKNKFANNDLSGAKTDLQKALQQNAKLVEAESLLNTVLAKIDEQQKQAATKAAADQAEAERVAYDTGITYNQLARTPNDFIGKKVKFSGKVVQVMEGDKEVDLRIAINNNYNTILYVGYDTKKSATRVLENDQVTVKGTFLEIYTYKSTNSGNISIPLVYVDNITIN